MSLNKILRYVIIVLLILLAILSITYKFDNCNLCSFEINNTKYNAMEFMGLYSNKCLMPESRFKEINYSLIKSSLLSLENLSERK
jgi:hypothetical protein